MIDMIIIFYYSTIQYMYDSKLIGYFLLISAIINCWYALQYPLFRLKNNEPEPKKVMVEVKGDPVATLSNEEFFNKLESVDDDMGDSPNPFFKE